jgi:hypothetical protein
MRHTVWMLVSKRNIRNAFIKMLRYKLLPFFSGQRVFLVQFQSRGIHTVRLAVSYYVAIVLNILYKKNKKNKINPWRYSSDEPWPAEQPPLAVFPNCTRRYWVDMWSAHRIPQLHFQLSKPDRYLFIQVTTQFIRSRGWVDPVPNPTPSEKS